MQDVRNAGMTNAKPAILLMIRKLPEANIIETVNSIRARLPELQETIPAAIDLQIAGIAPRPSAPRLKRWSKR